MKCVHCNKKTTLLVTCKCGKLLCLKHRFSDKHICSYVDELFKIEKIVKEKIIQI